jgi:hypothetical protein
MPNTYRSPSRLRALVVYLARRFAGYEIVGLGSTGTRCRTWHVNWA